MPPTLILHGTGDKVTPFEGAQAFHDAMLEAGNCCKLVPAEGAAHGYLMRERAPYEEALQETEKFLAALGLVRRE